MSRMTRSLTLYQYAAGLCDTLTGLLLILAPAWTLTLMRVHVLPQPIVFVSWIGAFVLSVGLTYLWVALVWPLSPRSALSWKMQWRITALIRSIVAVFLLSQIALGRLQPAWITVALTDGALASLQWIGLSRDWISNA